MFFSTAEMSFWGHFNLDAFLSYFHYFGGEIAPELLEYVTK